MRFSDEGHRGANVSTGGIAILGQEMRVYDSSGSVVCCVELDRKQLQALYHTIGDMLGKR